MTALVGAMYGLISLDAMFSGICAASGRNARVFKRAYYARSMLFGWLWGQVFFAVGVAVVLTCGALSADRSAAAADFTAVGWRMASVYAVYAAIVLTTFAIRAVPSVDVRSMTSTIGFGPLTFVRSAVIASGAAWGILLAERPETIAAAVLVALLMTPFRVFLNARLDRQGIDWLLTGDRVRREDSSNLPGNVPGE